MLLLYQAAHTVGFLAMISSTQGPGWASANLATSKYCRTWRVHKVCGFILAFLYWIMLSEKRRREEAPGWCGRGCGLVLHPVKDGGEEVGDTAWCGSLPLLGRARCRNEARCAEREVGQRCRLAQVQMDKCHKAGGTHAPADYTVCDSLGDVAEEMMGPSAA